MKPIRLLSTATGFATAIWLAFSPAFAADDPVFPSGHRVGLVPIKGLVISKTFPGFETEDHGVKVLIAELPPSAYGEVQNAFNMNFFPRRDQPESLQTAAGEGFYTVERAKDGADAVRRFSMIVPGGTFSGYVTAQVQASATKTFSDDAVRQMFASTVVRQVVPVEEQLGLMPFKITELSAFKNVRILAPGATILLADSDEDAGIETSSFMVIGTIASAPAQPEDRGRFPQQAAGQIPGLRDGRITMSESLRIDGSRMKPVSRPPAAKRIHRSRSCSGFSLAAATRRYESSPAPRARNGRKRSRVSAPCAMESSRAELRDHWAEFAKDSICCRLVFDKDGQEFLHGAASTASRRSRRSAIRST